MSSNRGFASLTPEQRRESASKGGKAAQATGRCHKFTGEEAKEAGRKGGLKVSTDKEHMARIGKLGGAARKRKAREDVEVEDAASGIDATVV